MGIIPNPCEKRFASRLMKNGQKSIRLNPIDSETSIRMNPNQSETKFSIQNNPNQSGLELIQTEFSIRMNQRNVSDWFRFIRIDVSELIALSRIDFGPYFIKRDAKRFSGWFGMIRIGSDTDIGNLNSLRTAEYEITDRSE